MTLSFKGIEFLPQDQFGKFDLPCPECSTWPGRSPAGRRRKVLRVWHDEVNFLTYHCVRCGIKGYARAHDDSRAIDPPHYQRFQTESENRDAEYRRRQRDKARWLWRQSLPLAGTIAEYYLRDCRRIMLDRWPETLRYLPPSKPKHHPALIACFGIPDEPEPGSMAIDETAVRGVHLTLLKEGGGKADVNPNKLMIASSLGAPIVVAPMNDLLGLAITEGIEEALTVHQSIGIGVWAAGAALRMPALAGAVPDYTDWITIIEDGDLAGTSGSCVLAERLNARGLEVTIIGSGAIQLQRAAA
jgi:hypothetical protein